MIKINYIHNLFTFDYYMNIFKIFMKCVPNNTIIYGDFFLIFHEEIIYDKSVNIDKLDKFINHNDFVQLSFTDDKYNEFILNLKEHGTIIFSNDSHILSWKSSIDNTKLLKIYNDLSICNNMYFSIDNLAIYKKNDSYHVININGHHSLYFSDLNTMINTNYHDLKNKFLRLTLHQNKIFTNKNNIIERTKVLFDCGFNYSMDNLLTDIFTGKFMQKSYLISKDKYNNKLCDVCNCVEIDNNHNNEMIILDCHHVLHKKCLLEFKIINNIKYKCCICDNENFILR